MQIHHEVQNTEISHLQSLIEQLNLEKTELGVSRLAYEKKYTEADSGL